MKKLRFLTKNVLPQTIKFILLIFLILCYVAYLYKRVLSQNIKKKTLIYYKQNTKWKNYVF